MQQRLIHYHPPGINKACKLLFTSLFLKMFILIHVNIWFHGFILKLCGLPNSLKDCTIRYKNVSYICLLVHPKSNSLRNNVFNWSGWLITVQSVMTAFIKIIIFFYSILINFTNHTVLEYFLMAHMEWNIQTQ